MIYKLRPKPGIFRDPTKIQIKVTEVYMQSSITAPASFVMPLTELIDIEFEEALVHNNVIDLKVSIHNSSIFVVSFNLLEAYEDIIPETDEVN